MSTKPRTSQRIKQTQGLSKTKTEFDLPPKISANTKTQAQGRIRPKTVPAKTLLKENARISKESSAEKKTESKPLTGQRTPFKTGDQKFTTRLQDKTKSLAIKSVNGGEKNGDKSKVADAEIEWKSKVNGTEIKEKPRVGTNEVEEKKRLGAIEIKKNKIEDAPEIEQKLKASDDKNDEVGLPKAGANEIEGKLRGVDTTDTEIGEKSRVNVHNESSDEPNADPTKYKSELANGKSTATEEENPEQHPFNCHGNPSCNDQSKETYLEVTGGGHLEEVDKEGSPVIDINSSNKDSDKANANHSEVQTEEQVDVIEFEGVGRYFSSSVDSDVTTPWLGGLAIVKSGDIICLDLNNERIKRFDKNFKMVSSIDIPFASCGMTLTSHDEIAVTCLNEIHFYNIGKFGMNRTAKYFSVNGMAHGIAHDQNWFAVTCDITEPDESTIRVIDTTGSERYVIDPPVVSGLSLTLTSFIEFDLTLGCIFLSDSAPSRIVCINFEGEALWDISIPGGSRGLVSIDDDNLLVCDQFSEKVRLLSKDGVLKSSVISSEDGLCNPDLIARKPDTNDVIVSYGGFGTIGLFTVP